VMLGIVLLGEAPSTVQLAGAATILVGMSLAALGRPTWAPPAEPEIGYGHEASAGPKPAYLIDAATRRAASNVCAPSTRSVRPPCSQMSDVPTRRMVVFTTWPEASR
jgi:hypothetical protein